MHCVASCEMSVRACVVRYKTQKMRRSLQSVRLGVNGTEPVPHQSEWSVARTAAVAVF